jgi:cytochrome b
MASGELGGPTGPSDDLVVVNVWDIPTRLTHWLLVVLLGFSWWSANADQLGWHRYSGYAILTLVLFRVYWGFVGSSTARFREFARGPIAVARYARSLFARKSVVAIGHNPMGGWSVLLLLALLLMQVGLGLFAVDVDGIESGPLAQWVSFETGRAAAKLHHRVFNVLLTFAALHIMAVLYYQLFKRHALISAMFSGVKRLRAPVTDMPQHAPILRAAVGLALSALLVAAIASGFQWVRDLHL